MPDRQILFPTYDEVLGYRRACARTQAAFGLHVTTPAAWLADAWELWGDGTTVISSLDRAFAVRALLSQNTAQPVELTDGGIALISRFFADAVGTLELDYALADPPASLSTQERFVVGLVGPYRDLLRARGLVEQGDALRSLAAQGKIPAFELGRAFELPPTFARLTPALAASDPVRIEAARPDVDVQFLFAAGPSAQGALIADHLRRAEAGQTTLVVSADPLALYEALAQPLTEAGIRVSVSTSRPFDQTSFGRAWRALMSFLTEPAHDVRALMDYFDAPIAGVDALRAAQIDTMTRGDRLVSFDELCALARLASPQFDAFEELANDADASLVLDYLSDVAADVEGHDPAYRSEQIAAIAGLRRVYETARVWDVLPADFSFAVDGLVADASRCCGSGQRTVLICGWPEARCLGEATFDDVVVCDLDDATISAAERHDALSTLEAKLGLAPRPHALDDARRDFADVCRRARATFACERVLSTGEGDAYPAFTLDEFIECYRAGDEPLDSFGLPPVLSSHVTARGEELFSSNASAGRDSDGTLSLTPASPGHVSSTATSLLLLSHVSAPSLGAAGGTPVLSPSAIETYVNCPYRWFVANRVRPDAPDEGTGPLEQGTFVHGVFEAFYDRLPATLGTHRVTPEALSEAQVLFSQVFDEQLAAQPVLETTRYVPLTPTEQAAAQALKKLLSANLAVQARFAPAFAPVAHELSIEPDQGIAYAGVILRGRIDRVDVDPTVGQYAIIDYKGGITGHDAGFDPDKADVPALPHKVQALIYAQALRGRVPAHPDARPVGALYLSYRAREMRGLVAGSYDAAQFDLTGTARSASRVSMNFGAYLDAIEGLIAARLDRLRAGDVAPDPLCADSCRFCPVVGCERRMA